MLPDGNITDIFLRTQLIGKRNERQYLRSCVKSRKYKISFSKKITGAVKFDGHLYLLGYRSWFYGCFMNNKPHILETRIKVSKSGQEKWRIKDMLTYMSPVTELNDVYGLKQGTYDHCTFVLTDSSLLLHYKLDYFTGHWLLLRTVKLNSTHKFKTLSYVKDNDMFLIESKRHVTANKNITYFVFCTPAPFAFVCMFHLSNSIHENFRNVHIYDELMVITTNKNICFYSVKDLLIISSIPEFCSSLDAEQLFESVPITELPPCLLKIPMTTLSSFSTGGFPWSCVIQKQNDNSVFYVYQLKPFNKKAELLSKEKDGFDRRSCSFYSDGRNRLLCVELDHIKVLKLNESPPSLSIEFQLLFHGSEIVNGNHVKYTSSGRMIKSIQNESVESLPADDIIHSVDYNADLDMIGVLYTEFTSPSSYMIGLYDNQNGSSIKNIRIESVLVSEDFEWQMYLDDVLIILILQSRVRRYQPSCFIYQLH